jgi:hypothetical protein
MIAVLVYSVVRRYMKRTSPGAFTALEGVSEVPSSVALAPGETAIGLYKNPSPWSDASILFTSNALYLLNSENIERLDVDDIIGYESPPKTDVTGVRVLTRDGFRFVRVAGCFGPNGNRKDAFSFVMLVRALIPGTPVIVDPERGDH